MIEVVFIIITSYQNQHQNLTDPIIVDIIITGYQNLTDPHGQVCLWVELLHRVDRFDHLQTKPHTAVSVVRPEDF